MLADRLDEPVLVLRSIRPPCRKKIGSNMTFESV